MKTNEFLDLLAQNPEKPLLFEYETGQFVPEAYHITEIKNVSIESVDCGGKPHSEKQTIVQLWHNGIEIGSYMEAKKAKKIFDVVDKVKPLTMDTEIYFEYGNKEVRTSNFKVQNVVNQEDKITFKLFVEPTACKPILNLNVLEQAGACCGTSSGCC